MDRGRGALIASARNGHRGERKRACAWRACPASSRLPPYASLGGWRASWPGGRASCSTSRASGISSGGWGSCARVRSDEAVALFGIGPTSTTCTRAWSSIRFCPFATEDEAVRASWSAAGPPALRRAGAVAGAGENPIDELFGDGLAGAARRSATRARILRVSIRLRQSGAGYAGARPGANRRAAKPVAMDRAGRRARHRPIATGGATKNFCAGLAEI
jgi:hypothetical protein